MQEYIPGRFVTWTPFISISTICLMITEKGKMLTFQSCKILSMSIINHCAVFWHLINQTQLDFLDYISLSQTTCPHQQISPLHCVNAGLILVWHHQQKPSDQRQIAICSVQSREAWSWSHSSHTCSIIISCCHWLGSSIEISANLVNSTVTHLHC